MHWTQDPARRADMARTVAAMHRARRRAGRRRRLAARARAQAGAQARRRPRARTITAPATHRRPPTIAEAFAALEARLLELETMRRALETAVGVLRRHT